MTAPAIHDIHNYFGELKVKGKHKPIIGNEATRLAITLAFPIENVPVIIRGEAGSAKTNLIEGMSQAVWGETALDDDVEQCVIISGGSDKALTSGDMVQRINHMATHCIISELEFIAEMPTMEDVIKVWLEDKKYVYKRSADFGQATDNIVLNPLPILTSLANENPRLKDLGEEMERRFMPFYTESSKQMNTRVHDMKARMESLPNRLVYQGGMAKLQDIQNHFQDIRMWKGGFINGLQIRNPCAMFMVNRIPKRFTISNTHIGYWHAAVRAVAAWNFQERDVYHEEEQDYILCTPADNYIAWTLMGKAVVFASLRLKDMGDILMDVIPTGGEGQAIDFGTIYDRVTENGYERSKGQIRSLVNQLLLGGYVRNTDGSTTKYWKTRDYSAEISTAIDWKGCVEFTQDFMKSYYPDIAPDYNPRFCADPEVEHPILGERIKMLDFKENLLKGKGIERSLVKRAANLLELDAIEG